MNRHDGFTTNADLAARYEGMTPADLARDECCLFGSWRALTQLQANGATPETLAAMIEGVQMAAAVLLAELQARGINPTCIHAGTLQ